MKRGNHIIDQDQEMDAAQLKVRKKIKLEMSFENDNVNNAKYSTEQFTKYGIKYEKAFLSSQLIEKMSSEFDTKQNIQPLKEILIDLIQKHDVSKETKKQIRKLFIEGVDLQENIFTEKRIYESKERNQRNFVFHPTRIITSQLIKKLLFDHNCCYNIYYGLFGISKTFSVILLQKLLSYIADYRLLRQVQRFQRCSEQDVFIYMDQNTEKKEIFYNPPPIPDHIQIFFKLPKLFYLTIDPNDTIGKIMKKIWLQLENEQKLYMKRKEAFTIKKLSQVYKQLNIKVHIVVDKVNIIFSKIRSSNYKINDYFYSNSTSLNNQGQRIKKKFTQIIRENKSKQKKMQKLVEITINDQLIKNEIQIQEDFFDDDYQRQQESNSQEKLQKKIYEIIKFQEILYQLSNFPLVDCLSSVNIEQYLKEQIKLCIEENKFDGEVEFHKIQYCELLFKPQYSSEIVDYLTYQILSHDIINQDFNQKSITSMRISHLPKPSSQLIKLQIQKLPSLLILQQILKKPKFERLNSLVPKNNETNIKNQFSKKLNNSRSRQQAEIIHLQQRQK